MKSAIGKIIMLLLEAALLVFTASRTLHLVGLALPKGEGQASGYTALAAMDLGAIGWLLCFMWASKGAWQQAIAGFMTFLDLLAIGIVTVVDLVVQSGSNGSTDTVDKSVVFGAIIFVGVVIFFNAAAFFAYHATDPSHLASKRKDALEQIYLDQINAAATDAGKSRAAQVGQNVAASMLDNLEAQYLALPEPAENRRRPALLEALKKKPTQPIEPQ